MKIIFIGCVESSETLLKQVLVLSNVQVVGIVTRKISKQNSDFVSLENIAKQNSISCCYANESDSDQMMNWIRERQPDVIYCFGWSYLLDEKILSLPYIGTIGYHPAELPQNRGRHPIIWTLSLGLNQTASTFFFMNKSADSGDLLDQEKVEVTAEDDARSLYDKLMQIACMQVQRFTAQLVSGSYRRLPQVHSIANNWRKRSKMDGQIDWRMSALAIYNLVRALSPPYQGAHCLWEDKKIKIWKVEVWEKKTAQNLEPGLVLISEKGEFVVKCGDNSALHVKEHSFVKIPKVWEYL